MTRRRCSILKLAEALAERADVSRRIAQLRDRINRNARFQEGEDPTENAAELLAEAERVLDRLQELIQRINLTNSRTDVEGLGTMTDALARRDVLRLRHQLLTSAADAAAGRDEHGYGRQMRSELRMLAALPVAELRRRADRVARDLRDVDVLIQQTNWQAELIE